MKKTETTPKTKRAGVKQGSYVAGATAIAIVICIVINLIVGKLPSTVLQPDISGNDLYQISDTSKDLLSGLQDDVQLIVMSTKDNTDSRIVKFLTKYAALSDKITVTYEDPVADPGILTQYDASEYDIVAVCDATGKTTSVTQKGWDGYAEGIINYDYYTYYQTYSSTGEGTYNEVNFDADGQITSAVNYVTSDVANGIVYAMTGHSETDLPSEVTSLFGKNFLTLNTSLDLLTTEGGIPSDCGLLIDYAPTTDLANDELTMLESYLKAGGNLMLIVSDNTLTNYNKLMSEYGMDINTEASTYVADGSKYYAQYASYYGELCFNPTLSSSSDITSDLYGKNAMLIYAYGITEGTPYASTVTLDSFMTTSSSATLFSSAGASATTATYSLGVMATDAISDSTTAHFTVFTSPSLINETILTSFTSFANPDIFMNAVTANFDNIDNVSIPSVSLSTTYVTISNSYLWMGVFVVAVPAGILAFGVVHWLKRRRK